MSRPGRYPEELRERAVRLVFDHREEHHSQWGAISSIADVRGYTQFTQERGDEAAARLAARFANIVRKHVGARDGSVIELRGDEALAVFRSPRQAIRAAVELQALLLEETMAAPDLPLPVGIGLDAGEAGPVEGGYRGGARGRSTAGRQLGARGPAVHLPPHRPAGRGWPPCGLAPPLSTDLNPAPTLPDMAGCPSCGKENPEGFAFCGFCTAPLTPPSEPQEVRKTVTLVFSDVTGSTALGEGRDPEAIRGVMNRYFAVAREVLERHGGTVEKFVGDAVMAAFGIPVVHEDDAIRAVRAALEMQQALQVLNDDLEKEFGVRIAIRTGVNTGEVVAGDASTRETFATGDTVNTAARLEQAAPPGEVLVGEATYRLVKDTVVAEAVEPVAAEGKTEPVPSYRLIEVLEPAQAPPRASGTPLVGRQAELSLLHQAFDQAVTARACHMVTVIGEAGVGKSRLIAEFLRSIEDEATVLKGRCLSYGAGITFFPVVEILKQAARISESDTPEEARAKLLSFVVKVEEGPQIAERLGSLLGLSESAGSIEETFWAVRKAFEAAARTQLTVVLIEDIHWAEPTLLDLLLHSVKLAQDAPILVLCTARPELLETHPGWGDDVPRSNRLGLKTLSEGETEQLIGAALGRAGLPRSFVNRIAEAGEGNPLFVEETLSMLKDEGILKEVDGQWVRTGGLESLAIPSSISALLESRIDTLAPGERDLLGRASVVGKDFTRPQVEALCEKEGREEFDRRMVGLSRRDLVVREPSSLEAYSFRHILIRDTAYRGMTKRLRAELHERLADFLEQGASDRLIELAEIVGYHLEQAYRYRVQLGPVEAGGRGLAARAAHHLSTAGRRALQRQDISAGMNLLLRVTSLLHTGDRARLKILPELGEAMFEAGKYRDAIDLLDRGLAEADEAGEGLVREHILAARLFIDALVGEDLEHILHEAERLIRHFEEVGDDRGLARTWDIMGAVEWNRLRLTSAENARRKALLHATRAGDEQCRVRQLATVGSLCFFGSTPREEGVTRCEEAIRLAKGTRAVEASTLRWLGAFHALAGDIASARALLARSREMLLDLGLRIEAVYGIAEVTAHVAMLADDPEWAERELQAAYWALTEMGESGYSSTAAAYLGQALWAQGRDEEAEQWASRSERMSPANDLTNRVVIWSTRAKVLARRGDTAPAIALANEAVEVIFGTEDVFMQGEALMDLAAVLRLASLREEEAAALRRALEIHQLKGNLVSARKVRTRLDQVAAAAETEPQKRP